MTAIVAAVTRARSLLAFVGILSLLGLDWTVGTRVIVVLALMAAVALEAAADGDRLWARPLRSVPAQRRTTA